MIITISGKPCCGKSTMAEIFCKKYGFERIYAGAIFKEEARKLGLSVKELSLGQEHFEIDYKVDSELKKVYNTRLSEDIMIESRPAFGFMPKAFNVFIDVDDDVMANRLLNSDRTGKEKAQSFEEALTECLTRYQADCKKYKKLYNIDCDNMNNYTFVINNSNLTPEQTADMVYEEYLKFIEKGLQV